MTLARRESPADIETLETREHFIFAMLGVWLQIPYISSSGGIKIPIGVILNKDLIRRDSVPGCGEKEA
jgi:hypothetical protein